MKRWNIYYLGDCIHASCEGETEQDARDECIRFSALAGETLNPELLVARPAEADEFTDYGDGV
jgi:hypothetical protein